VEVTSCGEVAATGRIHKLLGTVEVTNQGTTGN
jgi:hypothetical protein